MPGYVPYKGIIDATCRIIREEGIKTMYCGLVPSLLLSSHAAIQFVVYEELKHIERQYNIDIVFTYWESLLLELQNRSLLWCNIKILCINANISTSGFSFANAAT